MGFTKCGRLPHSLNPMTQTQRAPLLQMTIEQNGRSWRGLCFVARGQEALRQSAHKPNFQQTTQRELNPLMILVERAPAPSTEIVESGETATPLTQRIEYPSTRRPGWTLTVHVHTDARSCFQRLPGGWLYVATPVGLECFPDLEAIVTHAPDRGLDATLEALEHLRPLVFVAFDEHTEELQFGRSLDGFGALYFGGELPRIVIADSSVAVARRLGPVRLSKADEDAWYATRSAQLEGSFLEGVTRCFAGVRYRSSMDAHAPTRRLMAPKACIVDQTTAIGMMRDELRKICASYGNKRVALRLSGGVDSRVVLAGLMDAVREGILHKDQILCTSILFPGLDGDESAEIREIVRVSGFEWVGIEVTPERAAQACEESLQQDAPPFPTTFMSLMCMDEARARGAEIMLSGHGGDEIFVFDLVDVLGRSLAARLHRFALVCRLRRARGSLDVTKAFLQTLLGRRGLRGTCRTLRRVDLDPQELHAHRLDRRLNIAPGFGFEGAAAAVARRAMHIDIPLYRAGWWPHFDPVAHHHAVHGAYKAVAWSYMDHFAPSLAAVPARKVLFDSTLRDLFLTGHPDRDQVDSDASCVHATSDGYRAWRLRFEKRVHHEIIKG